MSEGKRAPTPCAGFAQRWWDYFFERGKFEDILHEIIGEDAFERIGGDYYDNSLEIMEVGNDIRLPIEAQSFIQSAGFGKVYVNHKDGWQTHYSFHSDEHLPVRGWRRRYVSDQSVSATRVLSGDDDNGYYEISYWPKGWTSPGCADWLSSGYMRIVPDPLDPFASVDDALLTPAPVSPTAAAPPAAGEDSHDVGPRRGGSLK